MPSRPAKSRTTSAGRWLLFVLQLKDLLQALTLDRMRRYCDQALEFD